MERSGFSSSSIIDSDKSYETSISSTVRNEDFWQQKKMTFQHSTFGASSKGKSSMRGYFQGEDDLKSYRNKDERGNHHSRMRISSTFGKNVDIPGPGSYNPDYSKHSQYESSQCMSVSSRPTDYKAAEDQRTIKFNKTVRSIEDAARAARAGPEIKQRKKKGSTGAKKKKETSALADVGIEALYASLLPGPGSYKPKEDWGSVKFERPAKAMMAPRTRIAKARPIMDIANIDIVSDRTREKFSYGGVYNVQTDPRKVNKKFTIGRQRPLLTGIEILPVGPGYYADERAFPFVGSGLISRSPDKKSHDVNHLVGT